MRFQYLNSWTLKKHYICLLKSIKQVWSIKGIFEVSISQMRFLYWNLWLPKKNKFAYSNVNLYTHKYVGIFEERKNKIVYNLNICECFPIVLWSTQIYLIVYKDTKLKLDEAKSIKRTYLLDLRKFIKKIFSSSYKQVYT